LAGLIALADFFAGCLAMAAKVLAVADCSFQRSECVEYSGLTYSGQIISRGIINSAFKRGQSIGRSVLRSRL